MFLPLLLFLFIYNLLGYTLMLPIYSGEIIGARCADDVDAQARPRHQRRDGDSRLQGVWALRQGGHSTMEESISLPTVCRAALEGVPSRSWDCGLSLKMRRRWP